MQVNTFVTTDLPTWAAKTMQLDGWVVLDTETTGIPGEIVDLAIIDHTGKVVMDQLIKPKNPIPERATEIHGITDADVWASPTFADVWPRIKDILEPCRRIITYNAKFDSQCMVMTAILYGITLPQYRWQCLMESYAIHHSGRGSKWQRLTEACRQQGVEIGQAHRALADAQAAYNLIKALAAKHPPVELPVQPSRGIEILDMEKGPTFL